MGTIEVNRVQRQSPIGNLSRRSFLGLMAGASGAMFMAVGRSQSQSAAPPRPHVKATTADLFINHGLNQEMR